MKNRNITDVRTIANAGRGANLLLSLGVIALLPTVAQAATVSLDFGTDGQYSGNFRQEFTDASTTATQTGASGRVSISSTRESGGTLYSTYDANGAAAGTSVFNGTSIVSTGFSVGTNGGSFGIYFYGAASNTTLVLINPQSTGSNERVRIINGGSSTAGTAGGTTPFNDAGADFMGLSDSALTELTVKYYEDVLNPGNALMDITVGAQSFNGQAAGAFFTDYQIGVRAYDANGGGSVRFDNFEVIPEPGSLALFGSLGMLGLLRRRRA